MTYTDEITLIEQKLKEEKLDEAHRLLEELLLCYPPLDVRRHALTRLCVVLIHKGFPQKAEAYIEDLRQCLVSLEVSPKVLESYNTIAAVYLSLSEYEKALKIYTYALDLDKDNPPTEVRARLLGNMANIYRELSKPKEALPYFRRSLEIFKEFGNKRFIAASYLNIGIAHFILSEEEEAYTHFRQALDISREINYKATTSLALTNIGNIYKKRTEYSKALECFFESLAIDEEVGRSSGVANNLANIADVYYVLSDYLRALEYYNKSLVLRRKDGSKENFANTLARVGVLHEKLQNYPLALDHQEQALQIFESIGDKYGEAATLVNKASIQHKLGKYSDALETAKRAYDIALAIERKVVIADAVSVLADIYAQAKFDEHDFAKAESLYLEAISMVNEINHKGLEYDIYQKLAALYGQMRQYEQANIYYEKYTLLKKEVFGNEQKKITGNYSFDHRVQEMSKSKFKRN